MSLLFIESFDQYTTTTWRSVERWDTINASGNQTIITGRTGNGMKLGTGSNTVNVSKSLPLTSEVIVGAAIRPVQLNSFSNPDERFFRLYGGGAEHIGMRCRTDGSIYLDRGGTNIGEATVNLLANTWYFIELRVRVHDTTGIAILRINGVEEVNFSGDTRNGGSAGVDTLMLHQDSSNTDYDDLYVIAVDGTAPNDWIGDCKIALLNPTGAGSDTDFTPSTGSNWQNVDENVPDGDTTYNVGTTVGARDMFAMEDLTASDIYGMATLVEARKDDGGFRRIEVNIDMGGTEAGGTEYGLGDSYQRRWEMRTKPGGGTITQSDINGMELGYEITL